MHLCTTILVNDTVLIHHIKIIKLKNIINYLHKDIVCYHETLIIQKEVPQSIRQLVKEGKKGGKI